VVDALRVLLAGEQRQGQRAAVAVVELGARAGERHLEAAGHDVQRVEREGAAQPLAREAGELAVAALSRPAQAGEHVGAIRVGVATALLAALQRLVELRAQP